MTQIRGLSPLASSSHFHFPTALSAGHWAVSGISAAPDSISSFDELSDGPIETFGTALCLHELSVQASAVFPFKLYLHLCLLFTPNSIKGLALYRWSGIFLGNLISASIASA